MTAPRVEIVILNWNGAADTLACLGSVFALDYPDFGVVVCDNGSTDDSVARIRASFAGRGPRGAPVDAPHGGYGELRSQVASPGELLPVSQRSLVLLETGANLGFAGGNNAGLRYVLARGDCRYVWLLNNDTLVKPTALRELVLRAESDPSIGAVGGTMLYMEQPSTVQQAGGATYSRWHGMVSVNGEGRRLAPDLPETDALDYISGGCMLLPVEVLERVGLLDDRFFMYAEDIDWCVRMRAAGYRMSYASAAHVLHKGGGSSVTGSPLHDYLNVKSSLLLVHKHDPQRLPVALAYSVYRCALPKVVRGQWTRLRAVGRALRDALRVIATQHAPAVVTRNAASKIAAAPELRA